MCACGHAPIHRVTALALRWLEVKSVRRRHLQHLIAAVKKKPFNNYGDEKDFVTLVFEPDLCHPIVMRSVVTLLEKYANL